MLSLFPQLFTYQEIAPLILRIAVGIIAISFSYSSLKKPAEIKNFVAGLVEFCAAVLLIAGFLTQLAAGLLIIAALYFAFQSKPRNYQFIIIFTACLLALIFLGPGFFSFDLPL